MREIKFRVWNKELKRFLDSFKLDFSDDKGFIHGCLTRDEDCIVEQYTGLKDKNNKEIYEGDIVKTDSAHITLLLRDPDLVAEYTHGKITWLCSAWKVCQERVGATYAGDYATCDCCPCGLEVIGNIHESSELMDKIL